ncbi:AAA family ATPase [Bacillus shivajii]|uniref:AAA family ATPase n=1 Tax=Bacillus shivajii TaxID=1983719 RepID=UPI001CFAE811|nr:AAA family ATPase [Bacillus shivajii]UCZ53142.1 AAA family ATPase [Bacillus shivajii]
MAEKESSIRVNQGKVITVCSAKGGIGQTLLSVNLALALKKKNLNICLIDGDLQFGDVSLAMDLKPSFTIKDLIDESGSLDEGSVTSYLTDHSSGVQVLPAPESPEFAELITSDHLISIVNVLRQAFDFIVIDAGHGLKSETVDLMDISDELLVVTSLEMTALKNTKLMIGTLEQLEMKEKVRLVMNRYNMESLLKPEEVPNMMNVIRVEYMPNNFQIAAQSLNLGIPVVSSRSKSDLSKSIFKMAENIISNRETDRPIQKKSLFGKVFPKKK